MTSNIYLVLSVVLAFLSITGILLYIRKLFSVTKINRVRPNMDPLPPMLRRIWPMIAFCEFHFSPYIKERSLEKRKQLLDSSGLEFFLLPRETFALQYLGAGFGLVLGLYLGAVALGLSMNLFYVTCLLTALGWNYPLMWLKDQQKKRNAEVSRYFPSFVDIVTLCCECGLTINTAIVNFCERGPDCVLRIEVERVVRDMKTGASRSEALEKFAKRTGNPDITRFVAIVLQCDKLGVPLGPTLKKFSEQKRAERFQRAEKLAMEAPMKMLGPLVIFIFPITFIIIAFPIVLSVIETLN